MRHLTEEQLIAHYYGDDDDRLAVGVHLRECAACTAEFARLRDVLDMVRADEVPDREKDYAADVWSRIAPRLVREEKQEGSWARLLHPPRWAWAGVAAVLMLAAFLAGRYWPDETQVPTVQTASGQPASEKVRERVLLVALGDHLDRSQMVLIELANAEPGAKLNIANERAVAEDLVSDNRLYRQAAQEVGEPGVSELLDELERVLVEIANGPEELTQKDVEALQKRIQGQGLIFKVRVVRSQTQPEKPAARDADAVKL